MEWWWGGSIFAQLWGYETCLYIMGPTLVCKFKADHSQVIKMNFLRPLNGLQKFYFRDLYQKSDNLRNYWYGVLRGILKIGFISTWIGLSKVRLLYLDVAPLSLSLALFYLKNISCSITSNHLYLLWNETNLC